MVDIVIEVMLVAKVGTVIVVGVVVEAVMTMEKVVYC